MKINSKFDVDQKVWGIQQTDEGKWTLMARGIITQISATAVHNDGGQPSVTICYMINDGQEVWHSNEAETFLTGEEAYSECDLRNDLDALLPADAQPLVFPVGIPGQVLEGETSEMVALVKAMGDPANIAAMTKNVNDMLNGHGESFDPAAFLQKFIEKGKKL